MLKDLTVTGFIEELASDSPAPGGGSIAALSAAQTAGLFAMVCELTVANKKYADAKDEMAGYIPELKEYEKFFIDAIDHDANSFNGVIAAFKMPKETDEEKAARKEAIQTEYKNAANVPFSTGMKAMELIKYAEPLILRGNQNAITDVGAGLHCLRSAVVVAFYNVKINLGSIKDEAYVAEKCREMDEALKELDTKISACIAKVEAALE